MTLLAGKDKGVSNFRPENEDPVHSLPTRSTIFPKFAFDSIRR